MDLAVKTPAGGRGDSTHTTRSIAHPVRGGHRGPGIQLHRLHDCRFSGDDGIQRLLNKGVEILFDQESGMLQRLITAPISPATILMNRLALVLALVSSQALIILLVAVFLGIRTGSGFYGLALISTTGILFAVGITAVSMALHLVSLAMPILFYHWPCWSAFDIYQ